MNNRYQLLTVIDENVSIGFDQLKQQDVVLKKVTLSESYDINLKLLEQLHIASTLRHANLIPLIDYFVNETQSVTTVSPVVSDSRLFMEMLKSASRDAQLQMLTVLLEILEILHENHLIHGAVRPENVLFSPNGNLLVKDFGLQVDASVQDDLYAIGLMLYAVIVQDDSLNFDALLNSDSTPDLDAIYTGNDAYDDRLRMVLYWLFACKDGNGYSSARVAIEALTSLREEGVSQTGVIKQEYTPFTPLIGRDRVLRRFEKLLTQGKDNQGALWFLHGAHGIGKTQVLTAFKHRAQLSGYTVLSVRANPWHSVWMQIVKQLLIAHDMFLEQDQASILQRIAPEIGQILNLPDDTLAGDESLASDQVSEVITTLFESIDKPTVVLIDDIEYLSDYPLTLGYLHAIISKLPLILVCTTAFSDQISALKNRYRNATFINLKPLKVEDISALCQFYSKTQVHHLIEQYVFNQSQGNPFYAHESITELIDNAGRIEDVNHLELPKVTAPKTAVEIASNYLEGIEDRQAIILSALLGNTVDLGLLQDFMPENNLNTSWLYSDLFTVEFEAWTFKNHILRDGILEQLSEEERQRHSRYIAETLETIYPDKSDVASLLVYYWHMAGDLERELDNIRLSIDRIMDESYDYLQAHEMVDRALTLLSETSDPDDSNRMEFLQLFGDICLKQQEVSQGLLYYFQALSLARIHDAQSQEIHILRRLANALIMQGEDREALAALERSFDICTRLNDMPNCAFVLYELAVHYVRLNDYHNAYKRVQRCFRVFDILPESDPQFRDLLTRLYTIKGTIVNQRGDVNQSVELFQSAIERLRQYNGRKELVQELERYAEVLISQVNFEFAEEVYQEILQHYKKLRDYSAYQNTTIDYARLMMMMGQLEDAENEIRNALSPTQFLDTPELTIKALMTASMIAFSAKSYADAIDYYKQCYELGESHNLIAPTIESTARRAVALFYQGGTHRNQARGILGNASARAVKLSNNPALQLTILVQSAYLLVENGKDVDAIDTISYITAHPAYNALHEFEIRHYIMPVLEQHMSDEELQSYFNRPRQKRSLSQLLRNVIDSAGKV